MIDITPLVERLRRARAVSATAREPSAGLDHVLDELDETWAELSTAVEELNVQNDQLATAQTELERERRRYRNLFDFAPHPCVVTDAKGLVRAANEASVKLLQISGRGLVGKPLVVFVPLEFRGTFRHAIARLPQLGLLKDWELPLQPRQSAPVPTSVAASVMPHDVSDADLEILWIFRDLAEQRHLYDRLRELREDRPPRDSSPRGAKA
jgi:PAS domain-containing protein